jgi:hypothetical protein
MAAASRCRTRKRVHNATSLIGDVPVVFIDCQLARTILLRNPCLDDGYAQCRADRRLLAHQARTSASD